MKNLKDRLVSESKTGDMFLSIYELIKNPEHITVEDRKACAKFFKDKYGKELNDEDLDAVMKAAIDIIK